MEKLREENFQKKTQEKIGGKRIIFFNFKVGKNFLNCVQTVQTIKIKLNFLSRFKTFVFSKEIVN